MGERPSSRLLDNTILCKFLRTSSMLAKIIIIVFRFYMDLFRCLYAVVFRYSMYGPLEMNIQMRL